MEGGLALHLYKLLSPLLKDAFCQVWLKLAQWFWRRFPLEEGMTLILYKLETPLLNRLVETGSVILEKIEMWKIYDNNNDDDDNDNNNDGQRTNFDQKSPLEASA